MRATRTPPVALHPGSGTKSSGALSHPPSHRNNVSVAPGYMYCMFGFSNPSVNAPVRHRAMNNQPMLDVVNSCRRLLTLPGNRITNMQYIYPGATDTLFRWDYGGGGVEDYVSLPGWSATGGVRVARMRSRSVHHHHLYQVPFVGIMTTHKYLLVL